MRQPIRAGLVVTAVGAVLGLWFASMSTADFAQHLDRQVHDVHCSFVPGLSGPEQGESGCQVTLVSQYSSVFRTAVWGGVPISLPAMAVFAFLLFLAAELWLTGRQDDPTAAAFLVAATGLPALTSVVMGYLSLVELDAVCKLCIGIYLSSALCFGGAIALYRGARRTPGGPAVAPRRPRRQRARSAHEPAWTSAPDVAPPVDPEEPDDPALSRRADATSSATDVRYLAGVFAIGVLFVLVPVLSYVVAAPDHSGFIGECGALPTTEDDYGVMIPLDPNPGAAPAIEVLDPLCPACRGFERALSSSGFDDRLDRRAVLFPLDPTCNWMVDVAVHPGACTVSYAMLCADERAGDVLEWAFDNQEQIREATAADPRAAERMVAERFPDLARCVRSQPVKSRLNRSLRWAVANRLPVLTPQLYVGGAKLCDEDVDLGLEFALSRLLDAHDDGSLARKVADTVAKQPPPTPIEREPREAVRAKDDATPGDGAESEAAAPEAAEPAPEAADAEPGAEGGRDAEAGVEGGREAGNDAEPDAEPGAAGTAPADAEPGVGDAPEPGTAAPPTGGAAANPGASGSDTGAPAPEPEPPSPTGDAAANEEPAP